MYFFMLFFVLRFLPIISLRPVFPLKMLFEQCGWHRFGFGVEAQRFTRQPRDELQHHRVANRFLNIPAPSEGTVTGHQNRRVIQRI